MRPQRKPSTRKRRRSHFLHRLARGQAGGALVEAAIVIPLGIFLFLGIGEFAQGFTVNRRIEAAAGTAADLVTRQPSVNTAELNGIRQMLDEMIRPFPTDTLRVRLTSISVDNAGQSTVAWSYANGPGWAPLGTGTTITVPTGIAPPNTSIIYAETAYTFSSSFDLLLAGGIEMRAESYFPPRIGDAVEFTD